MKLTFTLVALAAFAMAAPSEPEESGGVTTKGDISALDANQEFSLVSPSDEGEIDAQAYCGGYSFQGCHNVCYYFGTRCWMCTTSYCNCNNYSC